MPIYLPPVSVSTATTSVPGLVEVDRNALSGTPTAYTKDGLAQAPALDVTRGLLSLGGSPFDGTSPGHFVGGSEGTDGSTLIATNVSSSFGGLILDCQVDGVNQVSLDIFGPDLTVTGTYANIGAVNSNPTTLSSGLNPGYIGVYGLPTNVIDSSDQYFVGYNLAPNFGALGSYYIMVDSQTYALTCNAHVRRSTSTLDRYFPPAGSSAVVLTPGTITLRTWAGGSGYFTIPWIDALSINNTGGVTIPVSLSAGAITGPIASASVLGVVKVGSGLAVAGDGTLSASGGSEAVRHNGTLVGTRPTINLIDGSNVTLTVADNAGSNRVDVTVASSGGGATTVPYCAVSGTPNHTMAASGGCGAGPFGSSYVVPFPTTDTDQGTASPQHSTVSNTSRLTCQSAGVYLVTASAVGQSSKHFSTAGYTEQSASLVVVKNAATFASSHAEFGFTDVAECVGSRFSIQGTASLSSIVPLAVGDYIEVWVGFFDNSGNNDDTLLVIGPTFAMVKVGS